MHIFAFDTQGQFLSSLEAERKRDYICPECQQKVRIRGGYKRRRHFYHLQKRECSLSQKSYLHLVIQLYLANIIPVSELCLEKSFPPIRRIADCVWETKKLIFEIQCSPIKKEEIFSRIRDYRRCGYTVVWILHDKTFSPENPNSSQMILKKFPHYYTNIGLAGKGIIYDYFQGHKIRIHLNKPVFASYSSMKHPLFRKEWPLSFENDPIFLPKQSPYKKEFFLIRFLRALARYLIT